MELCANSFPDILTAKDISKHLQLTPQQIYNLFSLPPKDGGIPSFKIGKSRRVYKEDYLKWLSQKRGKAVSLTG